MQQETRAKTRAKASSTERKCPFEMFAPAAQAVCLAGSFNGWDSRARPLKKTAKGLWKTTLTLPPGRYEYRFLVDGRWENDPRRDELVPNGFGSQNNLIVID